MFSNIETPCLILDKDRLELNAEQFLKRAEKFGILLRPHLKTAKSLEVAQIATGHRMSSITVSTLKEAEYFAENGFTDILYSTGITSNKFIHVKKLKKKRDNPSSL